jgi:RNA polymerase sigma factor (sigma-70 family)
MNCMTPRLDSLSTRQSLLCRLRDEADQTGWQRFYDTYANFIFSFALRAGCTHSEAEEVLQETVINVARNLRDFEYDPKVCAFKTWLLNQTVWRVRDYLRRRKPAFEAIYEDEESQNRAKISEPSENSLETIWESEWKEHIFGIAVSEVRREVSARQFQVFDLYVLKNWSVADVIQTLGVTRTSIYLAKHRVSALLKKKIDRLRSESF